MSFDIMKPDRCYTVAEIGINHNGNLKLALEMIDMAKEVGFDCVKFQKRTVDKVYDKEELDTPRQSPWGTTNRQQKEGLEFDRHDYLAISKHCTALGIDWTASPWDSDSVSFLIDLGVPFLKVPSAKITDKDLLTACADTKKPLFLSTGMCDLKKIINIVRYVEDAGGQIGCIYHCTSTYPSETGELNLLGLKTLMKNFPKYPIGYSGHERGVATTLMAVILGARSIERHITTDRTLYGSDQAASLEKKGCQQLLRDISDWYGARGDGVIKVYDREIPIAAKLRKVDDF